MLRCVMYLMLCLLVVSVCLNVCQCSRMKGGKVTSDTVRTSDTVYVEQKDSAPAVKDEKVTGLVVVHLPKNNATQPDSVPSEPLPCKGDSIVLPIVQRRYSDDSTYTAYVSGAMVDSFPRLDSIIVRQRTVTNTVTITNTIHEKRRHWYLGIGAMAGYGLRSQNAEIVLGGGVIYVF